MMESNYATEMVILVDEQDQEIGQAEKMSAHRQGLLHRAFSILLWDVTGSALLMQQRATSKYHSGGLWTNTCCSHPRPNEAIEIAAQRRLSEEMGISQAMDLHIQDKLLYQAELDHGMMEHELDYILVGKYRGPVAINTDEVMAYRWWPIADLKLAVREQPALFTVWFRLIMEQITYTL